MEKVMQAAGGAPDHRAMFTALLAQSFDGITLVDRATRRFVEVSGSFCDMTGFDRAELVGRTLAETGLLPDRGPAGAAGERDELAIQGLHRRPFRRKDGERRVAELSHTLLSGGALVLTIVRDVTERERQGAQLAFEAAITEAMAEGVVVIRPDDGVILSTNSTFDDLSGYERGELVGRPVAAINAPTDRTPEETAAEISAVLRRQGVWRGEVKNCRKDGTPFWCSANVVTIEHPDHGTVWISVQSDITARKQAEETRARLAAIVASSGDAVVGLLPDGRVDSWNIGAELLYGYAPDEVLGHPVDLLVAPELAESWSSLVVDVLRTGSIQRLETEDVRKDGSRVAVALTLSPIRNETGAIIGAARIARDITERKRFEHELQFFADHDPLTGLFNRRRFAEELGRHTAYAARFGEPAALMVADLDHFKYVNDTLGHRAGDELIRGVARLLRDRLRTTDILARLGGDEFAALLPRTDVAQAHQLAEELRQAVHDLKSVLDRHTVRCTMSIGIALLDDATGEDALASADLAMYAAKRHGRDRVALAGAQDDEFQTHVSWSQRLHDALEHGHFELYAQPIVDVATGSVSQHELLLRLHDEHGNVLPPAEFIYTAERLGIIRQIDRWVARQALRLLASDPGADDRYAVNVSGMSMADEGLLQAIEDELGEGVDPARLTFEITETAAIADFDQARAFVGQVERLGCTTALDDFGAGFGSFSYLKRLPVDYIKIDGDFVAALPGSASDQALVKAIVDVAHGLGKQTVAEHVSSAQALALLRSYGVEYAQGFYLGRPVPAGSLRQA